MAEGFLLRTLWPATFQYFNLEDWVTYEETRRPAGQERAQLEELAGTYRRYTEENAPLNERKAQFYITANSSAPIINTDWLSKLKEFASSKMGPEEAVI